MFVFSLVPWLPSFRFLRHGVCPPFAKCHLWRALLAYAMAGRESQPESCEAVWRCGEGGPHGVQTTKTTGRFIWVWLEMKKLMADRRFWSMFPLTRATHFGIPVFLSHSHIPTIVYLGILIKIRSAFLVGPEPLVFRDSEAGLHGSLCNPHPHLSKTHQGFLLRSGVPMAMGQKPVPAVKIPKWVVHLAQNGIPLVWLKLNRRGRPQVLVHVSTYQV